MAAEECGRREGEQEDKKLRKMKGEEKVEEEEDRKECKVMKSKRRNEAKPHGGEGGVWRGRKQEIAPQRKKENN